MIVEREDHLSVLCDSFDECRSGRGRVVVVTGPVACGKTELLRAFVERVSGSGARYLGAVASRGEQELPFGVLGQILRGADLPPHTAAQVARLLSHGNVTSILADLGPGSPDQIPAVAHALCMILLDLAESNPSPLIIGVDDLQFCDEPSLRCLSSLVRRFHTSPVMLLLTRSTQPGPAVTRFEAELPNAPYSRRTTLEPLSRDGVEALLVQRFSPATGQRLAEEFHRLSGGNPMLLQGLMDDLRRPARVGSGEMAIGSTFRQTLLSCLYRFGPTTLTLAQGLAVVDEPVIPTLLAELLDMDVESVIRATGALEAAGLLADGRLRHPLVAAPAVLDGMPPEERARLHTKVAVLLYKEGTPSATIARHQLAAQESSICSVPILHEAAEEALAAGDVDQALAYLRLTRQVDSEADERLQANTTAILFRSEWQANPSLAVRHVPALTAAVAAGHLTGRDALAPVASLLWFGQADLAREVLQAADRRPDSVGEKTTAHLRGAWLWLMCLFPATDGPSADLLLADGCATPTPSSLLESALLLRAVLTGASGDAIAATASGMLQAEHLGERPLALHSVALLALIAADRVAEAEKYCEPLLAEAMSRHTPTWHALLCALRADIALRRGDLMLAQTHARTALTAISAKSWGIGIGFPLSVLLQASLGLGTHEEAMAHLRMPLPDAMFGTPIGLYYMLARGRYYQARGNAHAALRDFRAIGELMEGWGMDFPNLLPWRNDAAVACLSLGRVREAQELAMEQLSRLSDRDTRLRALSLRVLSTTSASPKRLELLRQAVDALETCDDRLELAYALWDLSSVEEELGRTARAKATRLRAERIARRCGVVRLGQTPISFPRPDNGAVRADGTDVGDRPARLSEAEQRVAELAARGYSNRQIADKLFVTVSTVEQHLTRVYRKLRVNRRTDLPRASA